MKLKAFFSLALSSTSLIALVAGCSSSTAEPQDEEVGTDEAALVSCGAAKYNEAFGHYKLAVAYAKERQTHRVCEWENGYLWSIADEASRAVMTCGAFRDTIKTSPWAAPIRNTLDVSLTLQSLTGELLVIKDSPYQNWTSTERFFNGNVSFWARAEGAYGSAFKVDFRANGEANWGFLHYNDVTGDITWRTQPATYTITKIDGREQGKRRVTVKHGNKTESFTLGVDAGFQYNDAPIFTLTPDNASPGNATKLYSLVSECDA
jgi:hypothetical protein